MSTGNGEAWLGGVGTEVGALGLEEPGRDGGTIRRSQSIRKDGPRAGRSHCSWGTRSPRGQTGRAKATAGFEDGKPGVWEQAGCEHLEQRSLARLDDRRAFPPGRQRSPGPLSGPIIPIPPATSLADSASRSLPPTSFATTPGQGVARCHVSCGFTKGQKYYCWEFLGGLAG